MKKLTWLVLAGLVALPLAACEEGEEVVEAIIGTISGTVTIEGTGASGVTVRLSGAATASTTTDAAGRYTFANVAAGSYVVEISGYPADATFPATTKPAVITTQGQVVTVNFDGSYVRTASISGTVTAAGSPLATVTVTLSGAASGTKTTDARGQYAFTGLRAGSYTVAISGFDAAKYEFPTVSQAVTLTTGQAAIANFAGSEKATATLTATVTIDGAGASGITVAITGPKSESKTTGADGKATFTALPRGTYGVTISGYNAQRVSFDKTAASVTIADIGGSASVVFTGTFITDATITGRVFLDMNKNGAWDAATDSAFVGLTVTLSGAKSATTATGSGGTYTFSRLGAGSYTVAITNPNTSAYTFDATSASITIDVPSGTYTANFRAVQRTDNSIAGRVWIDNGDGVFTSGSGDQPVSGVTITLSGRASATTTTDASGSYSFTGLLSGSYTVTCTGCTAIANVTWNRTSASVSLTGGTSATVDFYSTAVTPTGVISGSLFLDENVKNDTYDGAALEDKLKVAGIVVTLEGPSVGTTRTTTTDADGDYSFTGLAAGSYKVSVSATDPLIPGNVAYGGAASYTVALPTSSSTAVQNFPYDIVQQAIRVYAYYGRDGSVVRPAANVQIDLYPIKAAADGLPATSCTATSTVLCRLGRVTTDASGLATFRFRRDAEKSPAGNVSDNVVYSVVTGKPAATVGVQADSLMEIAFASRDSIGMAPDTTDLLNTQIVIRLNANVITTDSVVRKWNVEVWRNDTTAAFIERPETDAAGRVTFTETTPTAAMPDTFFFRLSNSQPTAFNWTSTPSPSASASAAGRFLRVIHNGTDAVGDTVVAGKFVVKFTQRTINAWVHHEADDTANMTLGDNRENVDNIRVTLWRRPAGGGAAVVQAGPTLAAAGTGLVTFAMQRVDSTYYLTAGSSVGTQTVLADTLVEVGTFGGTDTISRIRPLTGSGGSSTFMFKYNNAQISGTILAADGTPAGGIRVRISADPRTIQPRRADTTVVTSGAGVYTTLANLREGIYVATTTDSVTAAGDSIWAFFGTANRSKSTDLQGSGDAEVLDFTATRMDTRILGIAINDRDQDNVIDPDEALAGLTITLYRGASTAADSLVTTTTTNANGRYAFSRLREGRYTLSKPRVFGSTNVFHNVANDTVVVTTGARADNLGANLQRTVGDTIVGTVGLANFPRWDYANNQPLAANIDPTHFTFVYTNTIVRGRVTTGAGVAVAGMRITLRRCAVEADGVFPRADDICDAYDPGAVVNTDTDSSGNFQFTLLREGRYEVTPSPATAGYGSTTPASYTVETRGDGDIEGNVNFTANP